MTELFDVEQPAIAKHLINKYNEKGQTKIQLISKWNWFKKRKIEVLREMQNFIIQMP